MPSKKIFGSNDSKDILVSFLNVLLYAGESKIQDLEIIDPYASGTTIGLKDSYLDVKAQLDTQEIVIIEMQVLNVSAFDKRVVITLPTPIRPSLNRENDTSNSIPSSR
ncbi:MAG TPA: Rpn family recombination-promoting nuclease/putative transposase [Oscillatoriales cyanobacterium M4454_W2019_049]|nr:MAG: Rpn family recombination-promoting nuclease/putative transposase [Cyanobacteria bacterium J055]HIK31354.1 Rpn family recombination-promoting nuclease/putative transposase [Oscillatoriales cyanobacterium M4454_W2019_049]